jgi:hypothetical protein
MSSKRWAIFIFSLALLVPSSVGATPAAAACDCHTATPPTGGAAAAHAPFVGGIGDCATCHVGWASPHPTAIEASLTAHVFWVPALTGSPSGGWIEGRHVAQDGPVAGVVFGQKRSWGSGEWVDIGQGGNVDATTRYTAGRLEWPRDRWASLRAVAAGAMGSPVILPASAVWRPKPQLRLALDGVERGVVTTHGAVTVRGRAYPTRLAGEAVRLMVFKLKSGKWVQTEERSLTLHGKCVYRWRIAVTRGSYRIHVTVAATEDHRSATTAWGRFRRG